jgi:hypothetical protein
LSSLAFYIIFRYSIVSTPFQIRIGNLAHIPEWAIRRSDPSQACPFIEICFLGLQPLSAVQRQGGRARVEDASRPDVVMVQLWKGPDRAQPRRVPQRGGRAAGAALARRRYPGGKAQSRHLLSQAGRRQRGLRAHKGS